MLLSARAALNTMEYTADMTPSVKIETSTTLPMSDPLMFSSLQTELERMKERMKELRKRILPLRKRLQKRMEEEQMSELRCGEFVLEMDLDSDSDSDSDANAVFTSKRVREHFGEEQYEAYCENNRRKTKKRRKLSCRRDIVDVDSAQSEDPP